MKNEVKCINLDWLEVFCIEPADLCANYFKNLGWDARQREYGTPQYREMFTLYNQHGKPFLEIRRNPYSLRKDGGIFEEHACHIRLSNRTCYYYDAVNQLRKFIIQYGYRYQGISRIDICCDQVKFDNGMLPQTLANQYMKEKIWKTHQSNLHAYTNDGDDIAKGNRMAAHGKETNRGRIYNSIKWGSPSSPISTKLYNKTLELSTESKDKWYIRDAWTKAGLCNYQKVTYDYYDSKTKKHEQRAKMVMVKPGTQVDHEIPIEEALQVEVWRVEFSIKSEGRNWINLDDQHRVQLQLDAFDTAEKLAYTFMTMQAWLFVFCKAEFTDGRKPKRKDRCKPIRLYQTQEISNYRPSRPTPDTESSRQDKIMVNRLMRMANEDECTEKEKMMLKAIAMYISKKHRDWLLPDPEKNWLQISADLIHLRKQNEEDIARQVSGEDTSWLECEDELKQMSPKELDKRSNRFKRYQQKRIKKAKTDVLKKKDELKQLIERYEHTLNTKLDLPLIVEELLGTPF